MRSPLLQPISPSLLQIIWGYLPSQEAWIWGRDNWSSVWLYTHYHCSVVRFRRGSQEFTEIFRYRQSPYDAFAEEACIVDVTFSGWDDLWIEINSSLERRSICRKVTLMRHRILQGEKALRAEGGKFEVEILLSGAIGISKCIIWCGEYVGIKNAGQREKVTLRHGI